MCYHMRQEQKLWQLQTQYNQGSGSPQGDSLGLAFCLWWLGPQAGFPHHCKKAAAVPGINSRPNRIQKRETFSHPVWLLLKTKIILSNSPPSPQPAGLLSCPWPGVCHIPIPSGISLISLEQRRPTSWDSPSRSNGCEKKGGSVTTLGLIRMGEKDWTNQFNKPRGLLWRICGITYGLMNEHIQNSANTGT